MTWFTVSVHNLSGEVGHKYFPKRFREGNAVFVAEKKVTIEDPYLRAYKEFKESVDLASGGFLPEADNLTWYLLTGIPPVPADDNRSLTSRLTAIDQRVTILKAVFVEINRKEPDGFLDEGLAIYDEAADMARTLLTDEARLRPGD